MIAVDLRLRRVLLAAAVASYAAVLVCFSTFERPGLGIGHFFYVAIVLAGMASGPLGGAAAGVVGTGLYAVGTFLNPQVPTGTILTVSTALRLVVFVLVGTLIGYYASRSRRLLARAETLTQELRTLARRDFVTGLPNQRAFQISVNARIDAGRPFALLVCDLPAAPAGADARVRELALSERLAHAVGPEADVARIGNEQLAVVAATDGEDEAAVLTGRIEQALSVGGRPATAGWASFPRDSRDGLGLYTAASERLYARKIARGEWDARPASVTAIRA